MKQNFFILFRKKYVLKTLNNQKEVFTSLIPKSIVKRTAKMGRLEYKNEVTF